MNKDLTTFLLISSTLFALNSCGINFNFNPSNNDFIPEHTIRNNKDEKLQVSAEDFFSEDSEVLGSKVIPHNICKDLIKKIAGDRECTKEIDSGVVSDQLDCFEQLEVYIGDYANCKGTQSLSDLGVKKDLEPYFSSQLLVDVKITFVDEFLLDIDQYRQKYIQKESIKEIAGMTFGTHIFINKNLDPNLSLYFHELVHAVQYRELGGFKGFMETYLHSALIYEYQSIPHEFFAFSITNAFENNQLDGNVENLIKEDLVNNILKIGK